MQWALEKKRKPVSHSKGGNDFYFFSSFRPSKHIPWYEHEDQAQVSPLSEKDKLRLVQPCVRACNKRGGLWGAAQQQLQREWPRLQGGAGLGSRCLRLL